MGSRESKIRERDSRSVRVPVLRAAGGREETTRASVALRHFVPRARDHLMFWVVAKSADMLIPGYSCANRHIGVNACVSGRVCG